MCHFKWNGTSTSQSCLGTVNAKEYYKAHDPVFCFPAPSLDPFYQAFYSHGSVSGSGSWGKGTCYQQECTVRCSETGVAGSPRLSQSYSQQIREGASLVSLNVFQPLKTRNQSCSSPSITKSFISLNLDTSCESSL